MKSKSASALALGASVSVLAFSIAAPAHAGTVAGISESTTSTDVNTTLTISNVGEDVLFGVDNTGSPSASSVVTDTSSGEISQFGSAAGSSASLGVATVEMINSGSATVRADAAASSTSGAADAYASVQTGVAQGSFAANGASASLTNNGMLTIKSIALAEGVTDGTANAYVGMGVEQYVGSAGAATASLTNGGTLNVAATANAQGASEDAEADAVVDAGIGQFVFAVNGRDATASIENAGVLNITATANAEGSISADASAAVNYSSSGNYVIGQEANAYGSGSSPSGNASVALTNASSGTISIAANADANANIAYGEAEADINRAFGQRAFSVNGDASAELSNAGSLNITAAANADGATGASADASNDYAFQQFAVAVNGGNGSAALANSGDLEIAATANAAASSGTAYAQADVYYGVLQTAEAINGGVASATLANSGTFNLAADAVANGAAAYASASQEYGIYQMANANGSYSSGSGSTSTYTPSGNASVELTNASTGAINIGASANAAGTADYGWAYAYLSDNIYQYAESDNGDASATLTNAGTLNLTATAAANAANSAWASASVENAIEQSANAGNGGNASVTLTNASTGTINITAAADAVGDGYAGASASVYDAVSQAAYTNGGGTASVTLANSGAFSVTADVAVSGATAYGSAEVGSGSSNDYAIAQQAYAYGSSSTPSGNASVALTNASTGTINIAANAQVNATTGNGYADAFVYAGVGQSVRSYNGDASVTLANSGKLNVTADAAVTGATAEATAEMGYGSSNNYVIGQQAIAGSSGSTPGGDAAVVLTNASSGTINIAANAQGNGTAGYGSADAHVYGAVGQSAISRDGDASVTLANSGAFSAIADATASGSTAQASAGLGNGYFGGSSNNYFINQQAIAVGTSSALGGNATAVLTNASTGTINIAANALGNAVAGNGSADAHVYGAVGQSAGSRGGDVSVALDNSGKINVNADATASGSSAQAYAIVAPAIVQAANPFSFGSPSGTESGELSVTLTNASSGAINVAANATASGDTAYGVAQAYAVDQRAFGEVIGLTFSNAGALNVDANLNAGGAVSGSGYAVAIGVFQTGNGGSTNLTFANSGAFTIDAVANAAGTSAGDAYAQARGYAAESDAAVVSFANSGTFTVNTKATGTTTAQASAVGAEFELDVLTGTLTNAGQLSAVANAAAPTGAATATGIYMYSAENTATLKNTGTISASALTADGASLARAIVVEAAVSSGSSSSAPFSALAVNEFTINNSGSIVARQSIDGGATWTHGLAIDTTNAPNPAVINLTGNGTNAGSIYGNIDISAVDVINVSSGETRFDGVVNPGGELEGQLNILSGGRLYLQNAPAANPSYDGPAQINVDALTIAAGGTLAIQLPTAPAAGASYPTITANTANISGATLEIRPVTANGLFADSATFADVIVAGTRNGTFASTVTTSNSPLLTFTPTYDGGRVSLSVNRVAFDAVTGLSANQTAVASGLEATYSNTLTGPAATLLGALFTQNGATYASSLDQLTGAQYASHLQSLIRLGNRFNDLLGDAGDCAASTEFRQSCRAESGGRIWGKIDYGRVTKDGDVNAPGYNADDWYLALGTDYNVAPNAAIGVGVAYVSRNEKFKRNNDKINSEGFQVGAYAVYDPGQFYFEGVVSYSDLNSDSARSVNVGAVQGVLRGSPDAEIWAVSGQTGYRLSAGDKSVVTPYVNLDFASAKQKGFTETGVDAANLVVGSNTHEAWATTAGAKWGGSFGGIVPELNLGWRHQFGDRVALVDAAFGALPGSDFQIVSQTEKRDSALVGLSINGKMSPMADFRVEYLGQFNSEFQSHSGGVTLTVRFGG